jgi:hypothetical protein
MSSFFSTLDQRLARLFELLAKGSERNARRG